MRSAMAGSNAGALQCSFSVQYASQTHDFMQNPLRYFALVHFREREVASIAGKERNDICILIETRAFGSDVIGNDEIGILRRKLFASVLRNVIGLRRKTDDNFLALVFRHFRQNVGGRFERNCQRRAALLSFFRVLFLTPVVSYRTR